MSRFYRLVIFAAICALGVLTPRVVNAQPPIFPNGTHASDIISGLYPGTDAGNCCWLGSRVQIRVTVPSGADTLLLNVYVPRFAAPRNGQSLRVQFADAPAVERCCFGAGEHELAFPLPAAQRHGSIAIALFARSTFVPKAIGLNDDPRHLSVMLRSVAFYSSVTGERFDSGLLNTTPSRASLIVLVLGGLAIFALTLRRPVFGVAALILTDPFLFSYGIHGTAITLPKVALVAVAVALAVRMHVVRRDDNVAFWLLLGAQCVFVLSMTASSLHAADHGAALRETLKGAQYALTFGVAYAAYRADPNENIVRLAIALAALTVSVGALTQEFTGAPQAEMLLGHDIARIAGPLDGPNQLSGYLGICVPAMLAFAVYRPALLLERIAIAIGCVACLLTFSRAGSGALVLAIVLLLFVRYAPRGRSAAWALAGTLFSVVFALAAASFTGALHGPADRIFGSSSGGDAFNGGLGVRSDLWRSAYALWASHIYTGIGPGNFELAVGRYEPGVRTHANSMYFQVLAEQGVTGILAMFTLVMVSIGVFMRRLDTPLALGACVAAVAIAFHQVLDCMWLYPKVGAMWWVLLALGAAACADLRVPEHLAERAVS